MPLKITYNDKQALVSVLARWSEAGDPDGPPYFKGLVRQANFSDKIKQKGASGYIGDPKYNAGKLVDFALNVGTNPEDGNAALGSILLPLIPEAGLEDATFIASLIVTYGLLQSGGTLDDLRSRYQIPVRTEAPRAVAPGVMTGPAVAWATETNQLELQGWFTPEPQWIDVAVVMKAATRARSVCRVEVGVKDMGTGLLIRPGLVLTNYHVMGQNLEAKPEVLTQNAAETVLRFGAFTAAGPAAAGQEVRLDKTMPVVASSARYDFALLRTDASIKAATDVAPFASLGITPVKTNPLYVLEHPGGGPMKLALNSSGVSWIDPELVTIQYTTKVAAGSSGSPCFDADWNLVALHHAGAGSKGEGILMKSIFDQIQNYLSQ